MKFPLDTDTHIYVINERSVDSLIAAHAPSIGPTLVTNNLRGFKRVGGLRCENFA